MHDRNTINEVKMQPTKWEKIFANFITDKELISLIYTLVKGERERPKAQQKNGQTQIDNSQRNTEMAGKHLKRHATLLMIEKMQIKMVMR